MHQRPRRKPLRLVDWYAGALPVNLDVDAVGGTDVDHLHMPALWYEHQVGLG